MTKDALPAPLRRVLVVEDEPVVARVLQKTLSSLGYSPSAVTATADEALAHAAQTHPDVALVDIRIHGPIDGIETADMLRRRFGIPVIFLTAHADEATVARAARTRPYGYLVKPVKPNALRGAIEFALQRESEEAAETKGPASPKVVPLQPGSRRPHEPGAEAVHSELDRILASDDFDATRRSREFLRFVVEEGLAGRGEALSQSQIATQVFGRREDFDPLQDPIVRIQAGRLRRSLERYYLLSGQHDPLRIELPRGHYAPRFTRPAPVESAAPAASPSVQSVPQPDDWPTIDLQRTEVVGEDPALPAAVSRFDEELAAELGRYRDVRVRPGDRSAGGSPARFALAASLRPSGPGFKAAARLIDNVTGEQLAADARWCTAEGRRKGSIEDAARVIAARIASEEGVVVQTLAAEGRRQSFPETSFGAVLRSYDFYFVRDPTRFQGAFEALSRTVAIDPECSLAWTRLARLSLANHAFGLGSSAATLEGAVTYAQNGVRLDPTSRRARCVLGSVLLVKGELAATKRQAEHALHLLPDSLVYLEIIGWLFTLAGEWERGAALVEEAVDRNPYHLPHAHNAFWLAAVQRGDDAAAYQAALDYRDSAFFWRPLMRASSLGRLDRKAEAAHEVGELLRAKPDFGREGRTLIARYVKFDEVLERIVDGLARAGLKLE